MRNLKRVALVGRPNVGKSTLFNKITGTRRAVVKDQPGVTRDIQAGLADWRGLDFEVLDTGGVVDDLDMWSPEVTKRALKAAETADCVIFVLDGKYGLHPDDKILANYLKQLKKPVLPIVNKIDRREDIPEKTAEFYELGFDSLMGASFEHKISLAEILDWIFETVNKSDSAVGTDADSDFVTVSTPDAISKGFDVNSPLTLTVVGKPNAGKSSIVNKLLGEDRVIVSPIAGTTVDSVTVHFEFKGKPYTLIDTAGLRRRVKREEDVERISAYKSEESIEKAQIVLVVIDAVLGPAGQDARIVELALNKNKAVILVMNKVDLAESKHPEFRKWARERVEQAFHFFPDIPVTFISAKTGKGLNDLFQEIDRVWEKLKTQISTKECNDFLSRVIRMAPAPRYGSNDVRFYYMTQTKQIPPSFLMFVNEPMGLTDSYRRYVTNQIKEQFDLKGIPIRIYFKKRERRGHADRPGLNKDLLVPGYREQEHEDEHEGG